MKGATALLAATLGRGEARSWRAALMLAALVLSISRVEAAVLVTHDAVVQQPRAFGYVLGDVVRQRVLLEDGGHAYAPD